MADKLMSDAELRRRKRLQGHLSQTTGTLGLAALGGTLAASRGGRTALRKIPQLERRIKAPAPKDPDRDKIKGAVTPVLATSAGLGGLGAFNFAAYTNAESRKRQQLAPKKPVRKGMDMPIEMGHYGEEGRPVLPTMIEAEIEKAWTPVASNFNSERSRQKRGKAYEGAALVGAGAGGAYTAHHGMHAAHAAGKVKPQEMTPVLERTNKAGQKYKIGLGSQGEAAIPVKSLKALKSHGGKALAGAAAVGAAAGAHSALKRKRHGSWQPYAKRSTISAFGVDHQMDR